MARIALRVLLGLCALVVLYLATVTVLLKTRLLRHLLNRHPEKFFVDYRSASMIWPGKLHVEGLYLRAHANKMELQLKIDSADARFELWPLVHRRFHCTRVRGQGVALRERRRFSPDQIADVEVDALPDIDGYENPPMQPVHPTPPVSDADYELWTLQLDDVDVEHVREVWLDAQRYTDDGRVRGSFYLRPARQLSVGPATYDARAGELHFGKDAMALDVRGSVEMQVDEVDPRSVPGSAVLRYFTTMAQLDARLPDVGWLHHYLPKDAPRVSGGGGEGHLDLRFARGTFVPGTHVVLPMKGLTVQSGEYTAAATLSVDAKIDEATGSRKPTALVSIGGIDVTVAHRYAEIWPLRSGYVGFLARSARLEVLDEPLADLTLSIDVPSAQLPDLKALAVFVPKGDVVFTGGKATLAGHVDVQLEGSLVQGKATVTAKEATMRWKKSALRGDVTVHAQLAKGHFRNFDGDLGGSFLDLTNVQVTGGGDAPPAWWGRVDATTAAVTKGVFRTDLAVKIKDARPVFALLDAAGSTDLPDWARDLFSLDGLAGTAKFSLAPERLDITEFLARGAGFTLEGELRKHGEHTRGVLFVIGKVFSFGIVSTNGSTHISPVPASGWYNAQTQQGKSMP